MIRKQTQKANKTNTIAGTITAAKVRQDVDPGVTKFPCSQPAQDELPAPVEIKTQMLA
jgi:hypothetical protein